MENDGIGWKMFAGIMILIAGTLNVIDGLVGLTQVNYIKGIIGSSGLPVTNNVKTWSWVVLVIGAVMILAGFLIFVGNLFGRIVGIAVASINLIVQLVYVNHNPFWSFLIVLVDVLIIYGLAAHGGRLDDFSAANNT
jgi:hypothetical protein